VNLECSKKINRVKPYSCFTALVMTDTLKRVILSTKGLSVHFGGLIALNNVDVLSERVRSTAL
jgi:hypothetical protein